MAKKKKNKIKVAMVKHEFAWGDRNKNIKRLAHLLLPLEKEGVDVVITPECFLDGYMIRDRKRVTSKKLLSKAVYGAKDAYVMQGRELAKRLKSYLEFGASERQKDDSVKNAAYLFGRKGEHLGTYYKVNPDHFYIPGQNLPVFETDFGKVGIVICADRRWPENVRSLRLQGARIILNPTWGWFKGLNNAIMQVRAYENGIPICFTHPRQSLICSAKGEIGAVLESNQPGVLVHQIDLKENVKPLNSKNMASSHPIQNRRPELYGALSKLD